MLCSAKPGDLLKARAHHDDQNEVSSHGRESLSRADWRGRVFAMATSFQLGHIGALALLVGFPSENEV
jgi:hypothetical protein